MIHTKKDFFNQLSNEIKSTFFIDANDTNLTGVLFYKAKYHIELFNNGCLNYRVFIGRLSKACGSTNFEINKIVEKYILSFGSYTYKSKK